METIAVLTVVGAAAWWMIRHWSGPKKKDGTCGCGGSCTDCPLKKNASGSDGVDWDV